MEDPLPSGVDRFDETRFNTHKQRQDSLQRLCQERELLEEQQTAQQLLD